MPSPEERQAKAQEAIAHYVKQLVPIFTAINQNLVDFAKMIKESDEAYDKEVIEGKGPMMVMVPREDAFGVYGEEVKKEGE